MCHFFGSRTLYAVSVAGNVAVYINLRIITIDKTTSQDTVMPEEGLAPVLRPKHVCRVDGGVGTVWPGLILSQPLNSWQGLPPTVTIVKHTQVYIYFRLLILVKVWTKL